MAEDVNTAHHVKRTAVIFLIDYCYTFWSGQCLQAVQLLMFFKRLPSIIEWKFCLLVASHFNSNWNMTTTLPPNTVQRQFTFLAAHTLLTTAGLTR